MFNLLIACPLKVTHSSSRRYDLAEMSMIVDFPDPEGPLSATVYPAGISRAKSGRIKTLGWL